MIVCRIYQRFIDGYPAIRSGDFLEFGAYVVVYVAEENSGQAEVCHFSFLVHGKCVLNIYHMRRFSGLFAIILSSNLISILC